MRPVNLFLTEDGVLKLGTYGLTTQAEFYSIKRDCHGVRILDLEVYERKNAVWSFETALIEMMGLTPCIGHENDHLPTLDGIAFFPFRMYEIKSRDSAGKEYNLPLAVFSVHPCCTSFCSFHVTRIMH